MKLYIQVKPNAKANRVEKQDESHFKVQVKSPPTDGKANQAVIHLLSEYFNVPKSFFSLLRGGAAKNKIIEFHRPS